MRNRASILCSLMLLAVGYTIGSLNPFTPRFLQAQEDAAKGQQNEDPISRDTLNKMDNARQALRVANEALISDGRHKPITKGVNPVAILAGGVDAQRDLEAGLGVDPGTFAGLYAGNAIDEVEEKLGKDAEGRLTYNKKVIQMYPISRIKQLYKKARVVDESEDF